jgi:hypothetical protein
MLLKLGLVCLPVAFAFSALAIVPPLIVIRAQTNPPAQASPPAPAAPADTNFIDPALLGGETPQVKALTDELAKEGVKPESFMDEHFLFASLIWGSIGGGYVLWAKRQREVVPFIGGMAMIGASFMSSWFWMSIVCIALIIGTHWLLRHSDL